MEGPNKTHLSLSLQFLLLSLNATLKLLDGLLKLGHYDLLVLQTSHGVVDVLVLLVDHGLEVLLVPLKINDDLLGDLQISLQLTPGDQNINYIQLFAISHLCFSMSRRLFFSLS